MMIIFSLLPIYPLDGYRVYATILNCIFDEEYSYNFLLVLSLLSIVILFVVNIFTKSLGFFLIISFLIIKQIKYHYRIKQNIKLKNFYYSIALKNIINKV